MRENNTKLLVSFPSIMSNSTIALYSQVVELSQVVHQACCTPVATLNMLTSKPRCSCMVWSVNFCYLWTGCWNGSSVVQKNILLMFVFGVFVTSTKNSIFAANHRWLIVGCVIGQHKITKHRVCLKPLQKKKKYCLLIHMHKVQLQIGHKRSL